MRNYWKLLLLLVLVVAGLPLGNAGAEEIGSELRPVTVLDSVTTASATIAVGQEKVYDATTVLNVATDDLAKPTARPILRVMVTTDPTTTTQGVLNIKPSDSVSTGINGTTAAKTGLVLTTGQSAYIALNKRYLHVYCNVLKARYSIVRIR